MKNTLYTMEGASRMDGPASIDPASLTDIEAGVQLLALLARQYPGLTWGQLAAMVDDPGLSGWLTDLKKTVGDIKDGIGDALKDTGDWIGDKLGDAFRLAADEEVQDGASRIGMAIASGGKSEAAKGVLESIFGEENAEKAQGILETMGGLFKRKSQGDDPALAAAGTLEPYIPLMVGAGVLVGVVGLMSMGKKA